MLENLKTKGLIKNQLVLDVKDQDKAIAFIDLIDKTIAKNQSVQDLKEENHPLKSSFTFF